MIPRFALEVIPECASTNQILLERDGPIHGVALLSLRQTAGQGRRGRSWISASGSLAVSFGLEGEGFDLAALPFWFGVALMRAVRVLKPEASVSLKWPNDLYLGAGKLAGILVQARQQGTLSRVVVGVGMNLRGSPELSDAATADLDLGIEPEAVGKEILRELAVVAGWRREEIFQEWERNCGHLEKSVLICDPGQKENGRLVVALGLASNGGLRVRDETGIESVVYSEEVSLTVPSRS